MLPAEDVRYLAGKGYTYLCEQVGSTTLLIIKDYALPPGFAPVASDLMLEIPGGYPDAGLDMFWMYPAVHLSATSGHPPAADVFEPKFGGLNWQRFSRHGYPWRPGEDSIVSYLLWVRQSLERDVRAIAA